MFNFPVPAIFAKVKFTIHLVHAWLQIVYYDMAGPDIVAVGSGGLHYRNDLWQFLVVQHHHQTSKRHAPPFNAQDDTVFGGR